MSSNFYDATQDKLTRIAGGTLWAEMPLASLVPFTAPTSKIPSGFCLADGRALSRTTYADLFALIGTTYGSGDGSTTFNIPDMREATAKGTGLTSKSNNHIDADGLTLGEFLDDQLQAHTHSNKTGSTTAGQEAWTMYATSHVETATEQTNNGMAGRFGATTEVKSVGVNWIYKIKMVAVPADFMSKVDEAVSETLETKVLAGDTTLTPCAPSTAVYYDVTFDTPLPDTNYSVALQIQSNASYWANQGFSISNKTVNGFRINQWNAEPTATFTPNPADKVSWLLIMQ